MFLLQFLLAGYSRCKLCIIKRHSQACKLKTVHYLHMLCLCVENI